jgi:hypothetical protein
MAPYGLTDECWRSEETYFLHMQCRNINTSSETSIVCGLLSVSIIHSVIRKGLQALRGYSNLWNEQKVQVNVRPEIRACWSMGEISRSSLIDKSGRGFRNLCSCWCLCSPCPESSPRAVSHFTSTEHKSSLLLTIVQGCLLFCQWLLTKCVVNTQFYWWKRIHKGRCREFL